MRRWTGGLVGMCMVMGFFAGGVVGAYNPTEQCNAASPYNKAIKAFDDDSKWKKYVDKETWYINSASSSVVDICWKYDNSCSPYVCEDNSDTDCKAGSLATFFNKRFSILNSKYWWLSFGNSMSADNVLAIQVAINKLWKETQQSKCTVKEDCKFWRETLKKILTDCVMCPTDYKVEDGNKNCEDGYEADPDFPGCCKKIMCPISGSEALEISDEKCCLIKAKCTDGQISSDGNSCNVAVGPVIVPIPICKSAFCPDIENIWHFDVGLFETMLIDNTKCCMIDKKKCTWARRAVVGDNCEFSLSDNDLVDVVVKFPFCPEIDDGMDCVKYIDRSDCSNSDDFFWIDTPPTLENDLASVLSDKYCAVCPTWSSSDWSLDCKIDDCTDDDEDKCTAVAKIVSRCAVTPWTWEPFFCKEDEVRYHGKCEKCSSQTAKDRCLCGIKLNTVVPFIGDCILYDKLSNDPNTTVVTATTAFPKLMWGLSKIMMSAILVFSFVLVIVWGVMMTTSGDSDANFSSGKDMIMKVIVGLALLWASGVILKLINPNFFG